MRHRLRHIKRKALAYAAALPRELIEVNEHVLALRELVTVLCDHEQRIGWRTR